MTATLILLVRKVSADKVLPQIQVPGTVIQTSLSNEDEQRLQQALDAHAPSAAATALGVQRWRRVHWICAAVSIGCFLSSRSRFVSHPGAANGRRRMAI
jgi:Protein of unknown function (DUF1269)